MVIRVHSVVTRFPVVFHHGPSRGAITTDIDGSNRLDRRRVVSWHQSEDLDLTLE